MEKRGIIGCMAGLALWTASLVWADAPNPVPAPSNGMVMAMQPSPPAQAEPKAPSGPAIQSASGSSNIKVTLGPERKAAVPAIKIPAAAPSAKASSASKTSKAALADAFIAQNVLRIYLDRPAAVTVYNSRGQQVAHLDSRRAMETVPLQGITTGFIYLTVRTGQGELTKKLVYTGK
jgi:hypothetical protein